MPTGCATICARSPDQLLTPAESRTNRGPCHNADTDPDGHCVPRCANGHADADSDGYPDRYLLTFHSELPSELEPRYSADFSSRIQMLR